MITTSRLVYLLLASCYRFGRVGKQGGVMRRARGGQGRDLDVLMELQLSKVSLFPCISIRLGLGKGDLVSCGTCGLVMVMVW